MLRVTGGLLRGRALKTLRGEDSRPTLSRVREAVFNIIHDRVPGGAFLDLFCGVGTVGIEALSRGAARAVFVERDPRCRRILRENLANLGLEDRARVVSTDAFAWLRRAADVFDIVFADPPYGSGLAGRTLEVLDRTASVDTGWIIVQHGTGDVLPDRGRNLSRVRSRRYGGTVVDVYTPPGESDEGAG